MVHRERMDIKSTMIHYDLQRIIGYHNSTGSHRNFGSHEIPGSQIFHKCQTCNFDSHYCYGSQGKIGYRKKYDPQRVIGYQTFRDSQVYYGPYSVFMVHTSRMDIKKEMVHKWSMVLNMSMIHNRSYGYHNSHGSHYFIGYHYCYGSQRRHKKQGFDGSHFSRGYQIGSGSHGGCGYHMFPGS